MRFITFEGCDGSGKTTQAKILQTYLESIHCKAVFTKEPGGTFLADKIRMLLFDNKEIADSLTEFLLITAARRDHVNNFIKPQLNSSIHVICDRFFDSSLVYQGYVKGLDINLMIELHDKLVQSFEPDITFLLDIEPKIAMQRMEQRNIEASYYDKKDIDFHKAIRDAFLKVANLFPSRIIIINAEQSVKDIAANINQHIQARLHIFNK